MRKLMLLSASFFALSVGAASAANTINGSQSGLNNQTTVDQNVGGSNSATIEQHGHNGVIMLDQVGSNSPPNSAGGTGGARIEQTPNSNGARTEAKQNGTGNDLRVLQNNTNGSVFADQVGDNNLAHVNQAIRTSILGGSVVDLNQQGNQNRIGVNQGSDGTQDNVSLNNNNKVKIDQIGDRNDAEVRQVIAMTGGSAQNNNSVNVTQNNRGNFMLGRQEGSDNTMNLTQNGAAGFDGSFFGGSNANFADLRQNGNNNLINLTQTQTGGLTNSATFTQTNDNNVIDFSQNGTQLTALITQGGNASTIFSQTGMNNTFTANQ